MKRLVLNEPYKMAVEEVPVPQPGPGEALVKVRCVGVCGTDIRAWHGQHSFMTYPRVLGHEVAGEVVAFGPDASRAGVQVGDRVVIEPMVACGDCHPCRLGRYNCCERLEVLGVHRDGAMAEYIAVPANLLHKAPADKDFETLSFVEPACVALHAVKRSRVQPGDTAVVIGAGNIGLLALQMLKIHGAKVVAVDVKDSRLELARGLGADLTVNSRAQDPVKAVLDFPGGVGGNVIFEVVGNAPTVGLAFDLVSYAGQIVLVGVCHDEFTFRPDFMNKRELDLLGSRNSKGLFPECLSLIASGQVKTESLVTRRIPLEEFDATMRALSSGGTDEIKTVINL